MTKLLNSFSVCIQRPAAYRITHSASYDIDAQHIYAQHSYHASMLYVIKCLLAYYVMYLKNKRIDVI